MEIQTSCPRCGTIALDVQQVQLRLSTPREARSLRFSCPGCAQPVTHRLSFGLLRRLAAQGVKAQPAADSPRQPEARPITYDELLDFHLQFESEDGTAAFWEELEGIRGDDPSMQGPRPIDWIPEAS